MTIEESRAAEAARRESGEGYYARHDGGSSGGGGSTSQPEYFYNTRTGHYTYQVGGGNPSGSGWQSVGTTQPAGYVGGQARGVATEVDKNNARIKEMQSTGKYYYDPVTRVATTRPVEGQTGMTKGEVLNVIKTLPKETKIEYGQQYKEYSQAKESAGTQQSRELNLLAEPISLQQAMSAPKQSPSFFVPPRQIGTQESQVPSSVSSPPLISLPTSSSKDKATLNAVPKYTLNLKPPKVSGITVNLTPDVSKVGEYYGKKVTTWDQFYKTEKALADSNLLLFKQRTADQTKSMKQLSDIRIYEDVKGRTTAFEVKETAKPAIIAGTTMLGVAALGQAIPAFAAAKVPVLSKATSFVISPVGSKIVTGVWYGSLGYRGYKQAEYFKQGEFERGLLGTANLAAEMVGVYGAGKWLTATQGKPITKTYNQIYSKIKEPSFNRNILKWEKGIIKKDWTYSNEKLANLYTADKPQRTLFGEPISQKKINWLREDVNPGYYGIDIGRYKVEGYETKFFQKHLTDIYSTKAIDWRYPKMIDITPKTMITKGYSGILETQPKMFTFQKPPLSKRVDVTTFDLSKQTFLAPKEILKISKYDRPFYLSKPKLPKITVKKSSTNLISGMVTKTTPKSSKIKVTDMISGSIDVRPVYVSSSPKMDAGDVISTIPGGSKLGGALFFGGLSRTKDWTSSFSMQFGNSGQRAMQSSVTKQSNKLSKALANVAGQSVKQAPKYKLKSNVKVIPKLLQPTKQIPQLKQPTRQKQIQTLEQPTIQIPKLKQPVPTKPLFPTYPRYKEPEIPKVPPIRFPVFRLPTYGLSPRRTSKSKKYKRKFQYQPSLVAGFEKITTKQMKIPKILTGVGIRPVKF